MGENRYFNFDIDLLTVMVKGAESKPQQNHIFFAIYQINDSIIYNHNELVERSYFLHLNACIW